MDQRRGVAVATLAYVGPRIKRAMTYVLHGGLGVGEWVTGINKDGTRYEGLVLDFSINPGVQLIDMNGAIHRVSLARAGLLQAAPLPAGADQAWRETQIRNPSD